MNVERPLQIKLTDRYGAELPYLVFVYRSEASLRDGEHELLQCPSLGGLWRHRGAVMAGKAVRPPNCVFLPAASLRLLLSLLS